MIVRGLELDYFRNYVHLDAEFDERVNLIYGDNAQGKTNLLEAMEFLSCGRTHRARYDREMILFGVDSGFLRAELFTKERDVTLEAQLFRGKGRQLRANGRRLSSAGELTGLLTTVLFCPEDLKLIRDGSAARRRFLDLAICQLRPRYAQALTEYHRLYEHKTRILRDWPENPSLLDALDDFNLRMAQTGAILIHYRAHFIRRLKEQVPAIHADFSGGRESLTLSYETVSTIRDPLSPPKELLNRLLEHQDAHRKAELDARQCLSGPHKDDMEVFLDGVPARVYSSQGQARTAALSLKLAQREIFQQETGEWPVLLLDDVLSELDSRRQAFVLNRIRGGQVFITCCEEEKLNVLEGGRSFHVHGGALV